MKIVGPLDVIDLPEAGVEYKCSLVEDSGSPVQYFSKTGSFEVWILLRERSSDPADPRHLERRLVLPLGFATRSQGEEAAELLRPALASFTGALAEAVALGREEARPHEHEFVPMLFARSEPRESRCNECGLPEQTPEVVAA